MRGWRRSAGSGPRTWMLSNAIWTAWIDRYRRKTFHQKQHQQTRRPAKNAAAQTANMTKENRNENQSDERIRGQPGQGPALLYGGAGFRQEKRFQSGPLSLADRGFTRGPGRHGAAVGSERQPGRQSLSAGHISAKPARRYVLHRRSASRLRAYESARRRIHHAADRRDGL